MNADGTPTAAWVEYEARLADHQKKTVEYHAALSLYLTDLAAAIP